jgi:hypothetical protein
MIRKILSSLLVVSGVASPATAQDANACWRQALPQQAGLTWISSLVVRNRELMVVNPSSRELLSVGLDRPSIRKLHPVNDEGSLRPPAPLTLTEMEGRYLVKSSGPDGLLLGADLKPLKAVRLWNDPREALYPDWVYRAGWVLGYGAVVDGGSNLSSGLDFQRGFQLGILRARLDEKAGAFVDQRVVLPTESSDYFRIGYHYFAANDRGLFFVHPEGETKLYQLNAIAGKADEIAGRSKGGEAIGINALPAPFHRAPPLREPGAVSLVDVFRKFERAAVVAGLYGYGSRLYVLTRKPVGDQVEWLIFVLDDQFKLVNTVRLPTSSPHLTIAASSESWLIVERGPVFEWGQQEVSSILEIPSAWIDSPSSSRLRVDAVEGAPKCPAKNK